MNLDFVRKNYRLDEPGMAGGYQQLSDLVIQGNYRFKRINGTMETWNPATPDEVVVAKFSVNKRSIPVALTLVDVSGNHVSVEVVQNIGAKTNVGGVDQIIPEIGITDFNFLIGEGYCPLFVENSIEAFVINPDDYYISAGNDTTHKPVLTILELIAE